MALGGLVPFDPATGRDGASPFGPTPMTPAQPMPPAASGGPFTPPPPMAAQPVIPGPFGQAPQGQPNSDSWQQKLRMVMPAIVAAFGPKFGARGTAALLGGIMKGQEAKRAQTERVEQTAARRAMEAARFRMDALAQIAELPPEQQAVYLDSLADVGLDLYGVDLRGELARMQGASTATRERVEGEQATAKQRTAAQSVVTANDKTNPGNWSAPDDTGEMRSRQWWVDRAGTPGLLPGKPERATPVSLARNARLVDPETKEVLVDAEAEPEKVPANVDDAILAAHAKGDTAEVDRLLTLKARTAKAGRAPERASTGSTEQEWVIRGGEVTPIPKGTRRPGDQPYDAVAERQATGIADPKAEAIDTANEVVRIAKQLRDSPGFSGAFGVISSRLPTTRQATADAEVLLKSLRSLLTLENTGKLKGVLSNADMELLRQASSTLAAEMSEPAARAELDRLIEVMGRVAQSGVSLTPAPGGRARGTGPGPAADPLGIR